MAKLRVGASLSPKGKLSATLKGWLPILQTNILDLEGTLNSISEENPCIEVKSSVIKSTTTLKSTGSKKANREFYDYAEKEASLHALLSAQIDERIFPSQESKQIALDIIDNINDDGYFDGNSALQASFLGVEISAYERVRARFCYLEPCGVGASNMKEALMFHLYSNDEIGDDLYSVCSEIIKNLESHMSFANHPLYKDAMKLIKSFQTPPALAYTQKELGVIPDIYIFRDDEGFSVIINDSYYPEIIINDKKPKDKVESDFMKGKLKEARDLVDALVMRKATLRKIGLMILEYQYNFFTGGEIAPMRLKDIADEFGHNPSTISRAIADKYLECDRGIFPIKSFFSTAINENMSNSTIKDYVLELVKNEDKSKPLSDAALLYEVEKKFNIKVVRRTITKYRQVLKIASSNERKREYKARF